jgi:hypothetical protein
MEVYCEKCFVTSGPNGRHYAAGHLDYPLTLNRS